MLHALCLFKPAQIADTERRVDISFAEGGRAARVTNDMRRSPRKRAMTRVSIDNKATDTNDRIDVSRELDARPRIQNAAEVLSRAVSAAREHRRTRAEQIVIVQRVHDRQPARGRSRPGERRKPG